MKKSILVFSLLLCFALPSLAAEKAKVKVGKVSANINEAKENQAVNLSQSGNIITVGFSYAKTVIAGINTRSTIISHAVQFELEEGQEIEAGQTYDFSSTTALITATKTSGASVWGMSTLGDFDETPTATGSFKVMKYDSTTGDIKALFKAKVAPSVVTKGTKQTETSKPIAIKAALQAVLN